MEIPVEKKKLSEAQTRAPLSADYLTKIFQQEFFQEKIVDNLFDLSPEIYDKLLPATKNLLQYVPILLMNKNNGDAVLAILDDIINFLKKDLSEKEQFLVFDEIPLHTKAVFCNFIASEIRFTGKEQSGFANAREIMRLAGYIKEMTAEERPHASQYSWDLIKHPERRAWNLPPKAFEHLGKYEKVMLYSNIFCILKNCDELWGDEKMELREDLKTVILPYHLARLSLVAKADLYSNLLASGTLCFCEEMNVFSDMFFEEKEMAVKPIIEELPDNQRIYLLQKRSALSLPSKKPLFNTDETPTKLLLDFLKNYTGYVRRDFSSILRT